MIEEDSPQLKMLKLTLANLDWDDEGDERNESAFLPLPVQDDLTQAEHEDLEWVVARDKRKFANMPMVRDKFDFRVAPLFGALLQSPRLARLWAEMGDFFITAEVRGTLSELDRVWLDMGLIPVLVNGWVQSGNIAVAAAHGITANEITAIRENHLDSLAPEVRKIVDLAQATASGTITADQFKGLAGEKGAKWVVEAIGYIVFRIGSSIIDSALWQVQGIEGGAHIVDEMIAALAEGRLGKQNMMDKAAFARERSKSP
ncbi:MAG TPA: hypothetical protein VJM34_03155 [Novosphingobium sp.]|nr:hypothetical protein [Novosphingobium sp.]